MVLHLKRLSPTILGSVEVKENLVLVHAEMQYDEDIYYVAVLQPIQPTLPRIQASRQRRVGA